MVEPEPELEPENWVPVPQTIFVGQASCTNNAMVLSFQLTRSIWNRSQKLLHVGVGAGAKNLDAWSWSRSLKFEFRIHSSDWNHRFGLCVGQVDNTNNSAHVKRFTPQNFIFAKNITGIFVLICMFHACPFKKQCFRSTK